MSGRGNCELLISLYSTVDGTGKVLIHAVVIQMRHVARVHFIVNGFLVMADLIINLVSSMKYKQIEYVVCSMVVCSILK